jgi:hypothetical protein
MNSTESTGLSKSNLPNLSNCHEITLDVVEAYQKAYPGEFIYDRIEADYKAQAKSDLPPLWPGDVLEHPAVIDSSRTPEYLDTCDECGKPFKCECDPDKPCECGKSCVCDQSDQSEYFCEYHKELKKQFAREKASEESGEFTASMILGRAEPIFQQIAQETARTVGVPETLTVIEVLSAICTAIGKGLYLESRPGRKTPLGLYFQGFARSGTGKTESVRVAFKPIYDKQRELRESWKQELSEIEANLDVNKARLAFLMKNAGKGKLTADESSEIIRLKEEIQKLETQKNSPPSIWTSDATLAAMRDLLDLNSCQLSFLSDDAGKALQNLLGEHSNLKMPEDNIFLGCYSGSDITVDRVSKGSVFLPEPWANLFWLAQPDKIKLLTENQWLSEGGFLCRCLVARFNCVPHVMSDDSVSPDLLAKYGERWNLIYNAYRQNYVEAGEQKKISVSDSARALMKQFEKHIVDKRLGELADVDSFAARWIENTWRLAGVLHVARHLDFAHCAPLGLRDTESAITIMEYFIRQQLEMIHESRQKAFNDKFGRITEKLSRKGGSCSLGDFKNDGWDTDEVLSIARINPVRIQVTQSAGGDRKGRPGYRLRLLNFGERAKKPEQEPEEDETVI